MLAKCGQLVFAKILSGPNSVRQIRFGQMLSQLKGGGRLGGVQGEEGGPRGVQGEGKVPQHGGFPGRSSGFHERVSRGEGVPGGGGVRVQVREGSGEASAWMGFREFPPRAGF